MADRLCLPRPTPLDQDWEFTLPEALRTPELMDRAFEAHERDGCDDHERIVLFDILVGLINDDFWTGVAGAATAWDHVAVLVRRQPELHREQVVYWACPGSELEDAWAVTSRARALHLEVFGAEAAEAE